MVGFVVACGESTGGGAVTELVFFRAAESPIERGAEVALEWRVTDAGVRAGEESCALLRRVGDASWGDPVGVSCEGSHREVPPSAASASSVTYRLRIVKRPADAAEPFLTQDVVVEFVVPSVSIDPPSVSLEQGERRDFTASVSGAVDTSVSWSASGGSIDGSGSTVTYTAPGEAGTFSLRATSVADPNASASATILVAGVSVSIDPLSASTLVGGTVQFTASVSGTSEIGVTWSASCGSISGSGSSVTFVAPDFTGSCTVIAASAADPAASASAVVTVGEVAVAIVPTSASMDQGESRSFTASVSGATDPSVTWSATGGSLSGSGPSVTYTAPMEAGSFTVTAASVEDPGAAASAVVTVPELLVSIAPESATLVTDASMGFSASVSGAADPSLSWSASAGSITGPGASVTYTAPGVAGSVVVTAASVADPTVSASASVAVELVDIEIDPASAEVYTAETVAFTASVSGTSDTRVGWDASCGSISGSGSSVTFVAPEFAGSCVVTVTSVRDPRRTASATVDVDPLPTGDPLWSVAFGSMQDEFVRDAATDASGNVFIAGSTRGVLVAGDYNRGESDAFVAKLDTNGISQWVWQFGTSVDDVALLVAPQGDGGVLVGGATDGTFESPPGETGRLFLARYDEASRTMDWRIEFGTSAIAAGAADMIFDDAGDIVVAGDIDLGEDAVIAKFDENRDEVWTTRFGTYRFEGASAVAADPDGNLATIGTFYKFSAVSRFDSAGTEAWTLTPADLEGYHSGHDVAMDAAGNVYAAGTLGYHNSLARGYLIAYEPDESEIWRDYAIASAAARNQAVEVGPDGNVVVAGGTAGDLGTANPSAGVFAIKYDADGARRWTQQFGPDGHAAVGAETAITDAGEIVVAATVPGAVDPRPAPDGSGYDVVVTKLAP